MSFKWSNDEPNVIRSADDFPQPSTLTQRLAVGALVLLLCLSPLASCAVAEAQQHTPSELRAIAFERAAVHGANGWVIWRVVSECEVRSLNPYALGDGGTSHGLAQLSELRSANNLLGHFYSLGYTNPYSPRQAFDYLARAFSGEFRGSAWGDIGPHRWTCYRLLFGGGA